MPSRKLIATFSEPHRREHVGTRNYTENQLRETSAGQGGESRDNLDPVSERMLY